MSRPWMPLYVADYLADTSHLNCAESGAYLHLIMHYWQRGSLPNDPRKLASIARATPEQWYSMSDTIAEFFGAGWTHARIDRELEESRKAYERRALAGQKGGNAKASNAKAMPQQCSSNHNHNHKREKETPSGVSKKRATRLSADWAIPDEWVAEAVAEGMPSSQALSEAERMKNWSLSATTGAKLDWHASWRNWYRDKLNKPTPRATAPPNSAPKPKSIGEMFRDDARRMGLIDDEPIHESNGRLEARNGVGQSGGPGIARRIAIASDSLGGDGQGGVLRRS